jgi:hypothetical protein
MSATYDNAVHYEGDLEAIKRVSVWLAKYWESPENEGGLPIQLFEYDSDDEDPFHEIDFDLESTPDRLAKEVVDGAIEFCDGLESGKCRFKVKIPGIRSSITFTITVPEREMDDEISEGPHAKGITMQLMRHQERIMKQTTTMWDRGLAAFESMANHWQNMVMDKDKRIAELESVHTNTIRVFEEISSARHARDMEIRRLENEERRRDQVASTIMGLAPHLAGKLLGSDGAAFPTVPGGGMSRTPIEMALENMLNTFDMPQLQKLQESGILRDEQLVAFIQIAQMVRERQEAEEAAKAKNRSSEGAQNAEQEPSAPQRTG